MAASSLYTRIRFLPGKWKLHKTLLFLFHLLTFYTLNLQFADDKEGLKEKELGVPYFPIFFFVIMFSLNGWLIAESKTKIGFLVFHVS